MKKPKLSPAAIAAGARIEKLVTSYAYPRNGNTHNPTPRVLYVAWMGDKRVGSSQKMGNAIEMANEYAKDPR